MRSDTQYDHNVVTSDCKLLAERIDLDKFKNHKILIVGANGLIGGFLADFFVFLNNTYNCNIDLVLTSYSKKENASRIKHLTVDKNINYFSWDCSMPLNIEQKEYLSNVDDVYFCAGYGQPGKFLINTIKTTLINIVGVESILSYLTKNKNNNINFLFLSSSEVYANPPLSCIPTPETYEGVTSRDNNRACYIQSKKTGELLCQLYNQYDNVNAKSARVALTYGPGALRSDQRVMQNFIFKASNGEINMLDEGKSIRNYLYISDCVEMLINILYHGKHEVYNVGGDSEEISILDLANKISSILNAKVKKPKMKSSSEKTLSAPNKVALDISRYREEFKHHGEKIIFLNKGLNNTIKWFKIN